MNLGIILAAGKGTRFAQSSKNKTSVDFSGKPLIRYATDLIEKTSDKTLVVVGSKAESVKEVLKDEKNIHFVEQKQQLGTGHAALTAVKEIEKKGWKVEKVLLGYGDHMMFYTPQILAKLLKVIDKDKVMGLITCFHENPDTLAWGRIIKDRDGNAVGIVEQKVASEKERKIRELNAGLYAFDYSFLKTAVGEIKKNPVSGEYYLTDLLELAINSGKKADPVVVPFENVGIGINTVENYEQSVKLFEERGGKAIK